MAYTKTWIDKVNRGGLFPLNNYSFRLFVCIEQEVKHLLPTFMAKSSADSHAFKESIVKRIMHNEAVEWNWTLLSQCIDAESDAIELLEAIVHPGIDAVLTYLLKRSTVWRPFDLELPNFGQVITTHMASF